MSDEADSGFGERRASIRRLRLRIRLIAIASAVLATVVTRAVAIPKDNCHWDRSFAEEQRCFLAQFPCVGSYLGIDGPPDYAQTLKCFEANKGEDWPFVVLMYINGEGTRRDLKKAQAVLDAGQKAGPYAFNDSQVEALEKAIAACEHDPEKSCPRLDYCQDLAITTTDSEICFAVEQIAEEARLSRSIATARGALNAAEQRPLDRGIAEFNAYQLAEMRRATDANIEGTIRGLAGMGQAAFVRDNLLQLIAETVQARQLKPADANEYGTVDHELDHLYRGDIRDQVKYWRGQGKDREDQYQMIEEYPEAARASQFHWIKFRDSFAALAALLYRDRARYLDPVASMKTAMTKTRIAELRYNPVGPPEGN